MATKQELEARLAELEAARHRLMVGGRVESADSPGGDAVKFVGVSLADFDKAIADTKRELDAANGKRVRPIHIGFSLCS